MRKIPFCKILIIIWPLILLSGGYSIYSVPESGNSLIKCGADSDCKGERICNEAGVCVEPNIKTMQTQPLQENPLGLLTPFLLTIFGCFVVWVQFKYLSKVTPDPDVSLPTFSVTLIVTGTLVLVSTGLNGHTLGVVVGLFGTIAGYVLGRSHSHKPATEIGMEPVPPEQIQKPN